MCSRYTFQQPLAWTLRRTAVQVLSDCSGQQSSTTQSVREKHQQMQKEKKTMGDPRRKESIEDQDIDQTQKHLTETWSSWSTQQTNEFKHSKFFTTYRCNFTSCVHSGKLRGMDQWWALCVDIVDNSLFHLVPQCFYPTDCRYLQIFCVREILLQAR